MKFAIMVSTTSYLIIPVAVEQHPQLLGKVPPPLPSLRPEVVVVVIVGVGLVAGRRHEVVLRGRIHVGDVAGGCGGRGGGGRGLLLQQRRVLLQNVQLLLLERVLGHLASGDGEESGGVLCF